MLWILITIAAALFQNLRTGLQKALKGRLSTTGAAYARFIYGLPLAIIYFAGVAWLSDAPIPEMPLAFWLYCFLGGLTQILFTVVLLWLFTMRSFAVGTTFSKLEVIFVVGLGTVLLGDVVGPWALFAIALGVVGTLLLAMQERRLTPGALLRGLGEKATLVGLLSAALVGASSVFYRGATLAIEGDFIYRAALTLVVSLAMQTALMGAWFVLFDREELVRVLREWRRAAPVGLTGMLGSVGWFSAFALQNAAYVRAVGQIELVFAFAASIFFFSERITRVETAGIGLIVAAILMIVLGG